MSSAFFSLLFLVSSFAYANPLMNAIRRNDRVEVDRLLDAGVDVNRPAANGELPLLIAVSLGYSEIVLHLLLGGADPNVRDASGLPVLILAAHRRTIVEHLLLAGANPLLESPQNRTARIELEMADIDYYGPLIERLRFAERQWSERSL